MAVKAPQARLTVFSSFLELLFLSLLICCHGAQEGYERRLKVHTAALKERKEEKPPCRPNGRLNLQTRLERLSERLSAAIVCNRNEVRPRKKKAFQKRRWRKSRTFISFGIAF